MTTVQPGQIPDGATRDAVIAVDPRVVERRVVLSYIPSDRRGGVEALLALDTVLAGIVRTTREPIVGQMRLTWWHEALSALDDGKPVVGEPVLAALANMVVPLGVSGRTLATMIDAWEGLLAPEPIDRVAVQTLATGRGGTLFAALATVLGGRADPVVISAGVAWAAADLAAHLTDPAQAALAGGVAAESFDGLFQAPWPQLVRPLGMLALLARSDLAPGTPRPGSPRRLARLLMHRIWGR